MYIKTCYYHATSHPKLHERKIQPFYYAHQFCDSEIHKGHSRVTVLCSVRPGSSTQKTWKLRAGIIRRFIHSHVWSLEWVHLRLRLLSRALTLGLSTWCGFLIAWQLLVMLDSGLISKKLLTLLSDLGLKVTQCHFCHSDSRGRDLAPIFIAAIFGKCIYNPPHGNLIHLEILPCSSLRLKAAY